MLPFQADVVRAQDLGQGRHPSTLQLVLMPAVVQAADAVCVTCAGAGDPRLLSFRFRQVRCPALR